MITKYFTLLFSSLFWMRYTHLRKYTGYSFNDDRKLQIHYTFKYKRVPGVIGVEDLLSSEAMLSSFNSRDAFKIGLLAGKQKKLDTKSVFQDRAISSDKAVWVYTFLSILFILSLVLSNIFAKRAIELFGYVLPGGILIFPMTFAILDIITECFGVNLARKVIYMNIVAQIMFALLAEFFINIHPAPIAQNFSGSYNLIFGTSFRIVIAMIIASVAADMTNCYSFMYIKNRFNNVPFLGSLGVRCIISTAVAELLFSIIWVIIFFSGQIPLDQMLNLITNQYTLKVIYEVAALPITYFVVSFVQSKRQVNLKESIAV